MIFKVFIYRTDIGCSLDLGHPSENATKMGMFRHIVANGDKVLSLFDDCGEFEFHWNVKRKVWEFFDENKILKGFAKYERDTEAEFKKKQRQHEENLAAYQVAKRYGQLR